jgi:hypothetical protein
MKMIFGKMIAFPFQKFLKLLAIAAIVMSSCAGPSEESGSGLEKGFINPPESARPRVWWHWMNGNVTKEGIRADLEWMKRTGIGGFQNFDAGLETPQIVEKRLVYMTPEWKDAFQFTTKLADSLGLEMAIAGSPGWSESGGPWVSPAQGMKKLVWSQVILNEGQSFKGLLPQPPSTAGIFQNIPAQSRNGKPLPDYYADIAVLAYRLPSGDLSPSELKPVITSSSGKFDLTSLSDGDLTNFSLLPAARPGNKAWLQFEYAKPVTVKSLTIVSNETGINYSARGSEGSRRLLEVSDNGKQFNTVFEIPVPSNIQRTYTFLPVTGKYFRLSFLTPPPYKGPSTPLLPGSNPPPPPPVAGVRIAEAVLHTVAKINRFEDKAGFTSAAGLYELETPSVPSDDAVSKQDLVDLTSLMKPDGTLEWTPPAAGKWKIIRFGYSLTGRQNHPASPEATGLEVDKLNATHVKSYFENYLDQYKDATGGLMGKRGLKYIITDSWEAGVQNWTDSMMLEFKKLRGYDMLQWMPVLTGQIVESSEASEKFLWDFRKTISDLTTLNHYDQLTTILKNREMGRYTESHEGGRAFIGDGMEVKRSADIPMSATWTPREMDGVEDVDVATRYKADVLESASVAHIYGQNLVAAESMTARGNSFAYSPEKLKPTADMEMAMGLNLFVIHTSVHQPVDDKKPGLGLGPYGQWFTRHETWAEQAKPWINYLARSSYMLQQGKFVADILYFYGEDSNITALFGDKLPSIPEGFKFDFINADALVNVLSAKNGKIITPSGMNYSLLVLDPNSQYMSLPVLKKIRELAENGAVILGPKPLWTPSLSDDQDEFKRIADELWKVEKGENMIGKGKILTGMNMDEAVRLLQINPDFRYTRGDQKTTLLFVHRKLSNADIYWIKNRNNRWEKLEATFRISGKIPEIWHPVSGNIEPVSYVIDTNETKVPLNLEPNDALFIVFRKKAKENTFTLPQKTENQLLSVPGPWNVSFQPERGAPYKIILDSLVSWTEIPDPGVKYFSGTGTYTRTIKAEENWLNSGNRIWIDLGEVKDLAEVVINGQIAGIVWKTPFRLEITNLLKSGNNTLEIKVTNLWVNRLIGDTQPGVSKKYTYTAIPFYDAGSPLLTSGLLGPVRIMSIEEK